MSTTSDSRHFYFQVIDEIKRRIENGVYKEKQMLPSEFQLTKELGVSRTALREALRILEEDNIVIRRHGVGTFVNSRPIFSSGIEELYSIHHMIEKSGKVPASQYLSTDIVVPTEEEREKFAPLEVNELIKIERVRTADGAPVAFCIEKIPAQIMSIENIFKNDSLFYIMENYANKKIAYAVTDIEPISYHDRIFDILNCEPDQSLLLLKQIHYTENDEPILYSAHYFRPDVFRFHVLRKRS
ncbi:GntR family transcriptional regulator [Ornithinibacillus sp. 4-3]|uniref:GntR family transcriptional regulator n=1 Tax=Ornithinibacillus sp. 4-3 TaxID=3231488 RepID=A0AB39HUK1_9BACI